MYRVLPSQMKVRIGVVAVMLELLHRQVRVVQGSNDAKVAICLIAVKANKTSVQMISHVPLGECDEA